MSDQPTATPDIAWPFRTRLVLGLAWVLTVLSLAAFFLHKFAPDTAPATWTATATDPGMLAEVVWHTVGWAFGVASLVVNLLLRFTFVAPVPARVAGTRLLHMLITGAMLVVATLLFSDSGLGTPTDIGDALPSSAFAAIAIGERADVASSSPER